MSSAKHFTEVLIGGKVYTLSGFEGEEYLQKVSSYLNHKITECANSEGYRKQSADTRNVLLALNIADDYFKAKENADQMEEQKDRMEKETYSLKHELVSTQMKLDGVLRDLEERQRQLQELSAKLSKTERELRAAKKQAAQVLASGNEENEEDEVEEDEVVDTVIEGNEPVNEPGFESVSEMAQTSDQAAVTEQAQENFVQTELPLQNPSFQAKISDRELARKALQAARKAGSHRNGRRIRLCQNHWKILQIS